MKAIKIPLVLSATIIMLLGSCKKEETPQPDPPTPGYTIPTTYNFSNVSYKGQTQRLSMLDELSTYMKTANTPNTILDAQKMKDMYANVNNQFADTTLNTSGKQLKNKTFSLDQALFETYFDSLAIISQSTSPGSNGVAGVVVSTADPSKKYLFDKNGIAYYQIIEKELMGAVFYYQAAAVYLENIFTVDNANVVTGEGTAMEHNWDEAFGYLGVSVDFPTNTTGIKYWGKYSNSRNALLGTNATIMNAFLKGRAGISNKDYNARDEARTVIRDTWEKICAATAISYINTAKTNFTNDAERNKVLSECIGFVKSLKYSPTKKITDAQITQVLNYIGTNLYNVSITNLDNAKNLLSSIYSLDSVKNSL